MGYNYGEYGTLIACGDYEGNLEAIAKVLNTFEFDQGEERDQRFVVHDGRIKIDRFGLDSVSAAFPLRWWYTSEDGRRLPANEYLELPDEEDDGDWDCDGDDYEYPSLAQLSKIIAPLLTHGTLELVSVWQYKTSKIHFEKLAIRSDGWVQRQRQEYESVPRDKWHKHSTETYKPRKLPANDLRGTNSGDLIQKIDFGKEAHEGET
jgi:hypothetical protein